VCRVLKERGLLFGALAAGADAPRPVKAAVYAASRLYYFPRAMVGYGKWQRYLKSNYVRRQCERLSPPAVLHFMTSHLPFRVDPPPPSVPQYLYVDTSQRLWARYDSKSRRRGGRLGRDVQALERRTYAQMSHVFTTSEYVRDDLVEHYGVPPEKVTPVGTGRGKVRPFTDEKDYSNGLMLFVGRNGFVNKGGDLALAAFKIARARMPHLRLVMVCDPPEADRLRGLDVAGLDARSLVPWDELQSLYDRATLFVMPARHQPWGLAYLEALSCRMPIVGLDRLSTPELSGRGRYGWAVKGEDPAELADVLVEAYRNPARLAAMGAEGQSFCLERFTWEATVDRMLARMA
jgi:glycosyltransferase involved in cell wall biosynthesis